ncbi:mitochondrial ribosomal protein-like protein of the large subunit [Sporormia fimetaria CBS 119925]|uniref:Large ribosomal subunit protein bL32m n=1 Tax=Sporormia fimetaria CBS 119925 TaxID=1340428 RepID=A0A6A6V7M5_9PLEO|nr:mitochondrial ribosomal protein-like protein of the large subunit [Sporormia fimetaria CBS 119925]
MALARPGLPLWQALLPAGLNSPFRPVVNLPVLQRLAQPFRFLPTPFAALAIPSWSLPKIPSLSEIWDGVLKAVPKKKTSHRKKRQRFMAGKGLKDVTNLNRCSACGRVKMAHVLCPYCVYNIKTKIFNMMTWDRRNPDGLTRKLRKQKKIDEINVRRRLRGKTKEETPDIEKPTRW